MHLSSSRASAAVEGSVACVVNTRVVGLETSSSFSSFVTLVLNMSCPCDLLMNHSSKFSALNHLTVIINLSDAYFDYQ